MAGYRWGWDSCGDSLKGRRIADGSIMITTDDNIDSR